MSVKYILKQAGLKMGLNPAVSGERLVLLRFLNEAAPELYDEADMEGSLREMVFQVNGDQTISLPMYVGPLRAMRELDIHTSWSLKAARPRYNQQNWKERWRNWRIRGFSALHTTLTNYAPLTLTVKEVEDPAIVVRLTGPTQDSDSVTEEVTMSAVSVQTTTGFTDITAFCKDAVNDYNIALLDADDAEISMLPNNALSARYRIVDVSMYPWASQAYTTNEHYMEVLYKEALVELSKDGDEFPAPDYDNIIVNKMMQLWAEEQEKGALATAYDSKATRSMGRKNRDQKRGTEDVVSFVEHPHDTMLRRNRSSTGGAYFSQRWQ